LIHVQDPEVTEDESTAGARFLITYERKDTLELSQGWSLDFFKVIGID
jgi:hypothetical protein